MSTADATILEPIPLRRVHGETALFVVSLVIALAIWAALVYLAISNLSAVVLVGVYALLLAAVYFLARVGFVTFVRGNAARLGPDQFPELYDRVQAIARRMGMRRVPAAYLMQAGGALNALATRFIWRSMIVLYSDLMEACAAKDAAIDMIIGHELAHVRAGHLRLRWLLFPSLIVPFLGSALSRAREYTCDLMGFAVAGDRAGALLGLSVLAVGKRHGPRLAHAALVAQRRELNTGWMTLGQWVASHPPLAKRFAALDPELSPETRSSAGGTLRALAIILAIVVAVGAGSYFIAQGAASTLGGLLGLGLSSPFDYTSSFDESEESYVPADTASQDLDAAFDVVSTMLDEEVAGGGALPEDYEQLATLWAERRGDEQMPIDPYDGMELGYTKTDTGYELWSSGPDTEAETDDDIIVSGPRQ